MVGTILGHKREVVFLGPIPDRRWEPAVREGLLLVRKTVCKKEETVIVKRLS